MESLVYMGELTDVVLPSGKKVQVRETNGDDDGILSKIKNALDGTNIHNFLANIIVKDYDTDKKPLAADINGWLLNDKYYLLFKQRLINQGNELTFEHTCQNPMCKKPNEYLEDLSLIDHDLGAEPYEDKFGAINRYPTKDPVVEYTTSRGQKVRYKKMTGELEKKSLDSTQADTDKNSALLRREIEIVEGGKATRLFTFGMFPSKVMTEIRASVKKNDALFDPVVNFKCPHCGNDHAMPLLSMPVFFYPEGEI